MESEIIFHISTVKLVINNEIFKIPCNMAITEGNDKLMIVIKQEKLGSVQEMLNVLLREADRS